MTTIEDCTLITLPIFSSKRQGSITPVYNSIHVPFNINRVYYLYDVPVGSYRGGHAHRELQQLIVAASGSFDIIINDGNNERTIHLNKPSQGFYLPTMIWRTIENFSGAGICLVLASLPYDEKDYYRQYSTFINEKYKLDK